MGNLPFKVIKNEVTGGILLKHDFGISSTEEVMAHIFTYLANNVLAETGIKPASIICTVPGNYDHYLLK